MTEYNPTPVDTSNIELPDELIKLTEMIAENVHDVWAAGRIAEGWTHGEKKTWTKKPPPCLFRIANWRRVKKTTIEILLSRHLS